MISARYKMERSLQEIRWSDLSCGMKSRAKCVKIINAESRKEAEARKEAEIRKKTETLIDS